MALTKEFRETVYDRAQRDSKFRKALLMEAVNAYLNGDEGTGKAVLGDVINATIGFEKLAADQRSRAGFAEKSRRPVDRQRRVNPDRN
jgi:hypothetical protein